LTESSDLECAIDMIRQSASGIADRRVLTRVRRLRYAFPGFDRQAWKSMCEMGWLGLRVAEERGGVGLGLSAYCALAEELGAALVPEPLIGTALVASAVDDEAPRWCCRHGRTAATRSVPPPISRSKTGGSMGANSTCPWRKVPMRSL